jgi:hypothetical protein
MIYKLFKNSKSQAKLDDILCIIKNLVPNGLKRKKNKNFRASVKTKMI